ELDSSKVREFLIEIVVVVHSVPCLGLDEVVGYSMPAGADVEPARGQLPPGLRARNPQRPHQARLAHAGTSAVSPPAHTLLRASRKRASSTRLMPRTRSTPASRGWCWVAVTQRAGHGHRWRRFEPTRAVPTSRPARMTRSPRRESIAPPGRVVVRV